MTNNTLASEDFLAGRSRLTTREVVMVVVCWFFVAVAIILNRAFDARVSSIANVLFSTANFAPLIEAGFWSAVTVGMLYGIGRYPPDRGNRVRRYGIYIGVALGVFIAAAMLEHVLRTTVLLSDGRAHPLSRGVAERFELNSVSFFNVAIRYVAAVLAGLGRLYSLRYQAREVRATSLEARLTEARLDALRAQLQPHFLFNTLHAVSALVERDPAGVRTMIARLSELLRYSFEGDEDQEVELQEEIGMLQRYIDIMQIRLQDRLTVIMNIEGDAQSTYVPSLILQPLVENAIKHGVQRLAGNGTISIDAAITNSVLRVQVRNDGRKPDVKDIEPKKFKPGIGHRNVIARLSELYGPAHTFRFSIAADGWAVAEICIPVRKASRDEMPHRTP